MMITTFLCRFCQKRNDSWMIQQDLYHLVVTIQTSQVKGRFMFLVGSMDKQIRHFVVVVVMMMILQVGLHYFVDLALRVVVVVVVA